MWNMIQSLTGYLPRAFARASLTLSKVESGVTSLWPQWMRCVKKTEAALGFASSALYIEAYVSPASKKMVEDSFENIRHQFITNLNDVDWLDHETRARLAEKAEAVKMMVGYPDWILNPVKLDERYDKFCFDQGDFLSNKLCAIRYEHHRKLEEYGKPPNLTEYELGMWPERPDVVNAFYSAYSNILVAPAGILQPPFFTPDFPRSFRFATIGTILGHELTHAFDSNGRNFDKHGNLQNMWTQAAEEQFKEKVQCIIDQYSNYTLRGHHLHGKVTLKENIADNGGVKLAYKAYKAGEKSKQLTLPGLNLTNDQLFFLGFSQVWCAISKPEHEITALSTDKHAPNRLRVIGTLSNRKEFAEAFNCEPKKQMNPSKRCEVW